MVTIKVSNAASCKTAEKAGFVLADTKMYRDYFDDEEKLYHFYKVSL